MQEWFAVETRYRFEKRVVAQLEDKGFEAYLPLFEERHVWTDRRKSVKIPLFPGYAFVLLDRSPPSYQEVLRTSGLIRFVAFGGILTAISEKQIEDLRMLLQQKSSFSVHSIAEAGQKVRIRGGCLHGLEGTLVQHQHKLAISIHSIQRSLVIEIQGYDLELM